MATLASGKNDAANLLLLSVRECLECGEKFAGETIGRVDSKSGTHARKSGHHRFERRDSDNILFIYYDWRAVESGTPIAIRHNDHVVYTADLNIDGYVKERIKHGTKDCLLFRHTSPPDKL